MVPLSYAWNGTHVILATEATALSTRNMRSSGRSRIALGSTRDVVMIDASLDLVIGVRDAMDSVAQDYADQADWDPRQGEGDFAYLLLRPRRIQVWREANEIDGRTVMRDGVWTT